jgi:8-oxo-dGTP pyrophosphatase MutT (NUDIX family)
MIFQETIYRKDKKLMNFNIGKIIYRKAVRAVIIKNGKILMAHLGKNDEYKFPGGGKESFENTNEALKREVLEEVGYEVKNIKEKIGEIIEFDTAREGENNIFNMVSEYYLVEVNDEPKEQKLEEYEKELLFKPCWVEIKKAYKTNKEKIENKRETTPGIRRETKVLERLMEIFE